MESTALFPPESDCSPGFLTPPIPKEKIRPHSPTSDLIGSAKGPQSGAHKTPERGDWSPWVPRQRPKGSGQSEGQRSLFPHVPREVELPLCGPARPGTQPDEDGGTLNCTGASLESRTRLCLLGKLRASEAAGGEVAAAPQRGRLVQGSQPGPALMLGTRSAESPGRPGRRASFTNPERDGLRLLLGASRHHSLFAAASLCSCCSAGLPSQALASRLPSLFHRHPHLPQNAPL